MKTKMDLTEINGFKILEVLGKDERRMLHVMAECKLCIKPFRVNIYNLRNQKSCGCKVISIAKSLPEEINGFKIIQDFGYSNGSRRALAICKVCLREYEVDPNQLKYRKHCGCIKNGTKVCKYSSYNKRLMQCYKHMISRCYNSKNKDFYLYGEKGIIVCAEWYKKPDNFCEWALSNGYQDDLTIDRINSKGNYEPKNCRWATAAMQARNTSRNVMTMEIAEQIRRDKKMLKTVELSLKYNVSIGTILNIIHNKSWLD